MISRRQSRRLIRAASGTVATPALRALPRLHAILFFACLLVPLAAVYLVSRQGVPPALLLVLALAAVSLAAFAALPVGGVVQAMAAAGARRMWERRPGGLRSAWREVRPQVASLVWRGLGREGLFGGRDVAAWVYADARTDQATLPGHRLYGRLTAVLVVLGALVLGLPVALLLVAVVGAAGDPASELAASFLLGVGVSLSLALYAGGALGILGAVAAAAEHHEALHQAPASGFPAVTSGHRRSGIRFQRR